MIGDSEMAEPSSGDRNDISRLAPSRVGIPDSSKLRVVFRSLRWDHELAVWNLLEEKQDITGGESSTLLVLVYGGTGPVCRVESLKKLRSHVMYVDPLHKSL